MRRVQRRYLRGSLLCDTKELSVQTPLDQVPSVASSSHRRLAHVERMSAQLLQYTACAIRQFGLALRHGCEYVHRYSPPLVSSIALQSSRLFFSFSSLPRLLTLWLGNVLLSIVVCLQFFQKKKKTLRCTDKYGYFKCRVKDADKKVGFPVFDGFCSPFFVCCLTFVDCSNIRFKFVKSNLSSVVFNVYTQLLVMVMIQYRICILL
jgi:hypothetical protein